jgi:hypothetical protein
MFFSDILDVHNSCQPHHSHSDILGDGFLIQNNPVYRKIKENSLKIGCQYVEAYVDYLLLPFFELPSLVKHKKIPYVPAAKLMKKVEQDHPGVFTNEDVPLPESYHLHESSHLIAEHVLKKINLNMPQEKILKTMMAESFANTVDALVGSFAQDDLHLYFVKQNSYMHPQKKFIQALNETTKSDNFKTTFMLTFFSYLRANFLTSPLSKSAIQDLIKTYGSKSKKSPRVNKNIHLIRDMGEKLDPLFRYKTTANYFKQMGFDDNVEDLLDFDFMKVFESHPHWKLAVETLSDLVQV